ncbi:hypothetical protein Alg130_11650 [Pyrenophora tritici-repentis]|nr:hypothetical protein Alg130_11650 [Pyrenophora tritici-repentis]
MPQPTANALGNFDAQGFRVATVIWLVNQNHPLSELTAPNFREMIRFANPEAEAALWVVNALSSAVSKIHVSFDGWTTKGGKRGFFGVVAHFADAAGIIRDLPIDLPELAGAHTGEAIAKAISMTLSAYGYSTEEQYMREWRKDGPIGVLVDIINYIKTPQQYELFRSFQRRANADLPAEERLKVLEPVKPVVTRWNSYYAAFERATKLSAAYNFQLEDQARPFEQVDFNAHPEAPEDHLKVNLLAAWAKANDYYTKLDASPAYYAAVCLHPNANVAFQQLWAAYKPQRPRQSYTAATSSNNIDEAISAILGRNVGREAPLDEFER